MNYVWDWGMFLKEAFPGESYLDWVFAGLKTTVTLGLSAWVVALVLGILVGVLRTLPSRLASGFAFGYVEFFRNIPLLVQLFVWYFVVPELLPVSVGDAIKNINPYFQQFLAAFVCLGLYTSARIAEQVRSGIESLPRGQKNAGLALGFTLPQTYRYVLLPVSLRVIMPPMTSEFMTVFKNSAVASMIGLLDLSAMGRQLVDYTAQPYEAFTVITILYMVINMLSMTVMRFIERHFSIPGHLPGSKGK